MALACLLNLGATSHVGAQAAAATTPEYSSAVIAQKFRAMQNVNLSWSEIDELEQACKQAAQHADVSTLALAASVDSGPIQGLAIRKIAELPTDLQKQALVLVLREDRCWKLSSLRGESFTGQMEVQKRIRELVSQLLHRDLRETSKYYDPDPRKQSRKEDLSSDPVILDPAVREQAAKDLLASKD